MRTKIKQHFTNKWNLFWYVILITFTTVGVIRHGWPPTIRAMAGAYLGYLIAAGLIVFFFAWLPRYRAIRRVKKSGLLYLVLAREAFGKDEEK